jgi:hypothetical protein
LNELLWIVGHLLSIIQTVSVIDATPNSRYPYLMNEGSLIASNPILNKNPRRRKALFHISALSSSAIEGIRPLAKDLRKVRAKFAFLRRPVKFASV